MTIYKWKYHGYLLGCPNCGGNFEDGFYVPKKTNLVECPLCNFVGKWELFTDLNKFDLELVKDRFNRKRKEYTADLSFKILSSIIDDTEPKCILNNKKTIIMKKNNNNILE